MQNNGGGLQQVSAIPGRLGEKISRMLRPGEVLVAEHLPTSGCASIITNQRVGHVSIGLLEGDNANLISREELDRILCVLLGQPRMLFLTVEHLQGTFDGGLNDPSNHRTKVDSAFVQSIQNNADLPVQVLKPLPGHLPERTQIAVACAMPIHASVQVLVKTFGGVLFMTQDAVGLVFEAYNAGKPSFTSRYVKFDDVQAFTISPGGEDEATVELKENGQVHTISIWPQPDARDVYRRMHAAISRVKPLPPLDAPQRSGLRGGLAADTNAALELNEAVQVEVHTGSGRGITLTEQRLLLTRSGTWQRLAFDAPVKAFPLHEVRDVVVECLPNGTLAFRVITDAEEKPEDTIEVDDQPQVLARVDGLIDALRKHVPVRGNIIRSRLGAHVGRYVDRALRPDETIIKEVQFHNEYALTLTDQRIVIAHGSLHASPEHGAEGVQDIHWPGGLELRVQTVDGRLKVVPISNATESIQKLRGFLEKARDRHTLTGGRPRLQIGGKHGDALRSNLLEGEDVLLEAEGHISGETAAMVITDQGVLLACVGGLLTAANVVRYPHAQIQGVEVVGRVLGVEVVLKVARPDGSDTSLTLPRGDEPLAHELVRVIGERLHASRSAAVPAVSIAAAGAQVSAGGPTLAEQLRELAQLRREGVLSEEEFGQAKEQLLRRH